MNEEEITDLVQTFESRYGLGFLSRKNRTLDGWTLILYPKELHRAEGFQIEILVGWHSIQTRFIPGNLAGDLVKEMGYASKERKQVFCQLYSEINKTGGKITFIINNSIQGRENPSSWPVEWKQTQLDLKSGYIDTEGDLWQSGEVRDLILKWSGFCLSMVLCLLPIEEVSESYEGEIEGKEILTQSIRYERSKFNRMICIQVNGTTCRVCGMNFMDKYGDIGNGYIHIHHLTPLSDSGGGYQFDPVLDLVPVCPNCHAMLHRKSPPYTLEELISMLNKKSPM